MTAIPSTLPVPAEQSGTEAKTEAKELMNKGVKRKSDDGEVEEMKESDAMKRRRVNEMNEYVEKIVTEEKVEVREELRREAMKRHLAAVYEEVERKEEKTEKAEKTDYGSMRILPDASWCVDELYNIFPYGCGSPLDGDLSCKEFVDHLRLILEKGPDQHMKERGQMSYKEQIQEMELNVRNAKDGEAKRIYEEYLERMKADYEEEKKEYKKALEIVDKTTGRRIVVVELNCYILPRGTLVRFELDRDATFGELLALNSRAYNLIREANSDIAAGYSRQTMMALRIYDYDRPYNGESEIILREYDVLCKFGVGV